MIRATLIVPAQPSPESKEKKRKNLLRAARERLYEKRLHSQIKKNRQAPAAEF